ncbi:MAG: hypothetical protein ACOYLE_12135 [Bacteroidales bacterium]
MIDSLIHDTIIATNKIIGQATEKNSLTNIWMWLSIIELIIIFYLFLKKKKRIIKPTAHANFKSESLSKEIDFNNIINSSFNSSQLYDILKVKCHPDRFPTDLVKNKIADSIFQEISMNKTNYKKLLELKEEAILKLNINF